MGADVVDDDTVDVVVVVVGVWSFVVVVVDAWSVVVVGGVCFLGVVVVGVWPVVVVVVGGVVVSFVVIVAAGVVVVVRSVLVVEVTPAPVVVVGVLSSSGVCSRFTKTGFRSIPMAISSFRRNAGLWMFVSVSKRVPSFTHTENSTSTSVFSSPRKTSRWISTDALYPL